MAKKKKKAKDEAAEQAAAAPSETSPRLMRKTYLMTDDLIRRVERQAEAAGVGINEMNRYLLTVALDMVESGQHEIQVTTVTRRTLGV
ncbi:MAG: hypothetical protein QM346_01755 [Chloroflexota bacterium]|nr:hypothetical protein [Chloroflexota bacterium]